VTVEKRGRVDSKTLLIEAALEVIENEGVNELRLDAIAASVGVTKGSLYWHFKDRDDLIRAALQEQMRRVTEASMSGVSEALASSTDLAEYLVQVQSVVADPYNKDEVAERCHAHEEHSDVRCGDICDVRLESDEVRQTAVRCFDEQDLSEFFRHRVLRRKGVLCARSESHTSSRIDTNLGSS
jgi:AcrR family transcriptional regulator